MPGRYCLPGGHVDGSESLNFAAKRELQEETGIYASADSFLPVTIEYPKYSKVVFVSFCDSDRVLLNWEHSDYKWANYNECLEYDLVPGLITTLNTLLVKNLI